MPDDTKDVCFLITEEIIDAGAGVIEDYDAEDAKEAALTAFMVMTTMFLKGGSDVHFHVVGNGVVTNAMRIKEHDDRWEIVVEKPDQVH